MTFRLFTFIFLALVFLVLPVMSQAGSGRFVIDANDGYPESIDTQAFWTDTLERRNQSTGRMESFKYSGIAIVSHAEEDNISIFIKDYSGPGSYLLTGTGDQYEYASANNAVYSNDAPRVPHMVVKGADMGSSVNITKDAGGMVSGTYEIHVYMDGLTRYKPIKLTGRFESIPYNKK